MPRSRYRRITSFFGRVILSLIFWDIVLPFFRLQGLSTRSRNERLKNIAVRFRVLATDMGGLMIKVGQFLSSRVDVLPDIITKELSDLQDEVAPEVFADIQKITESELGGPIAQFFLEFNEKPMAAASLGQVHQATLHQPDNGFVDVVVKVQRPNIEHIIAIDMAALHTVGKWIQRYRPISKRANISALMKEFETITYQEIDYLAEGKNAETFAVNFQNRPGVRVPKVVWHRTTKRVLTLENVHAIKISDFDSITNVGIDLAEVAQRLFETYLQQIFEDGFFHADPHPGNLFIAPIFSDEVTDIKAWTLTFVDFGMVGQVPSNIRAGLREMAIGIGMQNPDRVINALKTLNVLLPSADLDLIHDLILAEFKHFWGKSMGELQQIDFNEIRELAGEYREVIYDLPFQIPENLLFLGRCVVILSGMCTGLNPDFNVWEGLAPFAKKIVSEETTRDWKYWGQEIGSYTSTIIGLPRRLDSALQKVERGNLAIETPSLNRYAARLEKSTRRMTYAIVFAALLMSGIQLYLSGEIVFSSVLLICSALPLLRVIFPGR